MDTNITKNAEEIKINSNIIKTGLLQYYRFGVGASAVCTELSTGIGISDVMVINRDGEVVEIEVKISKSDLLAEKKNKDIKHLLLEKSGDKDIFTKQSYCNCRPNRFYFCVPDYLVDDAIAFASELNPKYGVMKFSLTRNPIDSITIVKRSKKLHDQEVSLFFLDYITKRICNDLCKLYKENHWPLKPTKIKKRKDLRVNESWLEQTRVP